MLLLDSTSDLYAGDILRLSNNYDLGPGSGPVDLIVFDPLQDDAGMGLLVVSGYKSGKTLSIFPLASLPAGARAIDRQWLIDNWDDWFRYTYHPNVDNAAPIPIAGTKVLAWDEREIVEIVSADSRPA